MRAGGTRVVLPVPGLALRITSRPEQMVPMMSGIWASMGRTVFLCMASFLSQCFLDATKEITGAVF
jgi:hypothetical protein